jgi:hypothetical protein
MGLYVASASEAPVLHFCRAVAHASGRIWIKLFEVIVFTKHFGPIAANFFARAIDNRF